jgi:hypothetical protein
MQFNFHNNHHQCSQYKHFKDVYFLHVLLATRKPHEQINYKLVQQAKVGPKPVPTLPDSPSQPTSALAKLGPEQYHPQIRFLPSVPTTHSTVSSCIFLKLCNPNIRFLGSLWPTSTNKFDMLGLQPRLNMDPWNQNTSKQQITKR